MTRSAVDKPQPQMGALPGLRETMAAFATGVTVVATEFGDSMCGLTVNSFTSLSLDPALVLLCLKESSRALAQLTLAAGFSINVLGADQAGISRRFADSRRPVGTSAFDDVQFTLGETGCPNLTGSAAVLDCRVDRIHPGGDHIIVVGEVVALSVRPNIEPLVFHLGGYRRLGAPLEAEPAPQRPALRVVHDATS